MKHHLPSLDALKVFESAARQLSFSLAAQELCITKGAVSYQIRKLEESLDCALFRRATRQVFLTNAGQQLLLATQQLFAGLTRTLGQIKPADSSYDVHVGVTTYVAMRWLSTRIAGFSEKHPDVSLVLQHSVNSEEFKIQDVDITIRWAVCTGKTNRSRLIEMPMSLYPVCSPDLLHKLKLDVDSKNLGRTQLSQAAFNAVPLLCEDRPFDLWQEWYGNQESPLSNPRRVIADSNVRTQAAIDGQGWTMADALMQPELNRGELVAPFRHQLNGYGYHILVSPGRYLSVKARSLVDWLLELKGS
jgi:DNA-binding transcriptional LysR family regulator